MNEFHTLKVSDIKRETPNAISIEFHVPDHLKTNFDFKAGQYITIKHFEKGTEIRRAYSICSSPKSKSLRVGVKRVDQGVFTPYAHNHLKIGDELEVMIPTGKFVLEPNLENYVAFAAGSGITPILSLIKATLEESPKSNFLLIYGNKTREETMFYDDIMELSKQYPERLQIEFIFSRKEEPHARFGRIDRSIVNYFLNNKYRNISHESYYLCGPKEMIDVVSETLKDKGVPKENIHFELFTTEDTGELTENHEGDTEITIILDDEEETFSMPKKKSVLDAALDEGLDAPYSCQGGICSTCIARIKEGKAEMRNNQILTDSEIEEGLILTCQAHPTTPKIVVDYDDI